MCAILLDMNFFIIISFLAICLGGVLSAFTARKPTRFVMWLTAYLVLIVGVAQLGLAYSWLELNLHPGWVTIAAFIVYNFGNIAVMLGRSLKGRTKWAKYFVYKGGVLLAISMAILLWGANGVALSWASVLFYTLTTIILVSMPIGLVLSSRRRNK